MKAILISKFGAPDVLVYGDAPEPVAKTDELLVRVRATAINRADTLQRKGNYAPPEGASEILGLELAGEVLHDCADFKKGERVMAVVSGGSYAEVCTVPTGMAMRMPHGMSFENAAAIPEAFLTAWLNMFTMAKLQASERILIHAGASGVGTAAIQLAHAYGATAFATAGTPEKCAFCETLGAHAIHYKTENFAQRILALTHNQGVDVVLDFIGAPYFNDNLKALSMNGRLQLIGMMGGSVGQLDLGAIMGKRIRVTGTTLRRTPLDEKIALTQAFADWALPRFASSELKPIVNNVLPLREAATAHHQMEANANIGKIVLTV